MFILFFQRHLISSPSLEILHLHNQLIIDLKQVLVFCFIFLII